MTHRDISAKFIEDSSITGILEENQISPENVSNIVKGTHELTFFTHLIDSSIDVDRLDYLNRDSYHCGTEFKTFDAIKALELFTIVETSERRGISSIKMVNDPEFVEKFTKDMSKKPGQAKLAEMYKEHTERIFVTNEDYTLAISARGGGIKFAEYILHLRDTLYQLVYNHPQIRIAERMFGKAFEYMLDNELLEIKAEELMDTKSIIGECSYLDDDWLSCKIREVSKSDDHIKKILNSIRLHDIYKPIIKFEYRTEPISKKSENITTFLQHKVPVIYNFSKSLDISYKSILNDSKQMIKERHDLINNIEKELIEDISDKGMDIIVDIPPIPKAREISTIVQLEDGESSKLKDASRIIDALQVSHLDSWYGSIYVSDTLYKDKNKIKKILDGVFSKLLS